MFDVLAKVWTSDGLWKGFLRCAKMMAKESGATSFIAMVQLPDKKLKEALAHPLMKVCGIGVTVCFALCTHSICWAWL